MKPGPSSKPHQVPQSPAPWLSAWGAVPLQRLVFQEKKLMRANTGLQEVICLGFLHMGWGVASPPVPWWEIWLYKWHITTGKPQCPQIPKGLEEIFCHVVKGLMQGALQECWVPPKARGEIKKEGRYTFIVHCIHWLTQTPRGPSVRLNPQALFDTQTSDSGNTRLRSRNPLPLEGLAKFGFLSQYCLERRMS